jgi:hypothetical protein
VLGRIGIRGSGALSKSSLGGVIVNENIHKFNV